MQNEFIIGDYQKYAKSAANFPPMPPYKLISCNVISVEEFKRVCLGAIQYRLLNMDKDLLRVGCPLMLNLDQWNINHAGPNNAKLSFTEGVLDRISKLEYKTQGQAEQTLQLFIAATGQLLCREVRDFEKYKVNEQLYRALVKTSQLQFSQFIGKNSGFDVSSRLFAGQNEEVDIQSIQQSLGKFAEHLNGQRNAGDLNSYEDQIDQIKNQIQELNDKKLLLPQTVKLLQDDINELNAKLNKLENSKLTKEHVDKFFSKAADLFGVSQDKALHYAKKLASVLKLARSEEVEGMKKKVLEKNDLFLK